MDPLTARRLDEVVHFGLIRPENYVALVAAGLLSVIVFPLVALMLLRGRPETDAVAVPA